MLDRAIASFKCWRGKVLVASDGLEEVSDCGALIMGDQKQPVCQFSGPTKSYLADRDNTNRTVGELQ